MDAKISLVANNQNLTAAVPPAFSHEQLIEHFLTEQGRNSRTFLGISDTSTSEMKQPLLFTGEELRSRVTANVERQLRSALNASAPHFIDSHGVHLWIFYLSLKMNEGLTREGVPLLRNWETEISYQTPHLELEPACLKFSNDFFHKWNSRETDPIMFAAWIEQEWNGKIHPLSDGCGRTSKTVAALVLARSGLPYPHFESREEFFSHIGESYESWSEFYARGVQKAIESLSTSTGST